MKGYTKSMIYHWLLCFLIEAYKDYMRIKYLVVVGRYILEITLQFNYKMDYCLYMILLLRFDANYI